MIVGHEGRLEARKGVDENADAYAVSVEYQWDLAFVGIG